MGGRRTDFCSKLASLIKSKMEKVLVTHRVSDKLDLRSIVTLRIGTKVSMQPAGLPGFPSTLKVSIGR